MQQSPKTAEEKKAIELRDREQIEFYEDRIIKKDNKVAKDKDGNHLLVENMKEEFENIIGADGEPERVLKRVTGYTVSLNK